MPQTLEVAERLLEVVPVAGEGIWGNERRKFADLFASKTSPWFSVPGNLGRASRLARCRGSLAGRLRGVPFSAGGAARVSCDRARRTLLPEDTIFSTVSYCAERCTE